MAIPQQLPTPGIPDTFATLGQLLPFAFSAQIMYLAKLGRW